MLVCGRQGKRVRGGFLNSAINNLPFEIHLPGGYEFCGPGTRLEKRLARGDKGINQLDAACLLHDIAYRDNKDLAARHRADKDLAYRAWQRVKSKDASAGEKAAAWAVTTAMKAKTKFGMGVSKRKAKKNKNKKKPMRGRKTTKKTAINSFNTAAAARVLPLPKEGGFLPFLIPLFAGLSAAGALAGGASGIAKAVNAASDAKKQLDENARHNKTMEAIALGKKGSALYLKPYKSGSGCSSSGKRTKKGSALYLKPYKSGSGGKTRGGAVYLKPYSKN